MTIRQMFAAILDTDVRRRHGGRTFEFIREEWTTRATIRLGPIELWLPPHVLADRARTVPYPPLKTHKGGVLFS